MNCLKCGKAIQEEQVFCPQCLAGMEAYPVKPEVHIQLPNRPAPSVPQKAKKRRAPSAEEQVVFLRSRQRRLVAAVVALAVLLCATGAALAYSLITPDKLEWGTNYTFDNPFD